MLMHHIDGSHDDVIPRTTSEEQLYEHFKKTNWWAQGKFRLPLILLLVTASLGSCASMSYMEPAQRATAYIAFVLGFIFLPALIYMMIKYVAHDHKWEGYKKEWNMANGDNWSADVGGILKIYD